MGSTYMAGFLGDHCPQDRPGDIARISRCRDMETHGNGRTNKFLVIGFKLNKAVFLKNFWRHFLQGRSLPGSVPSVLL